MQVLWYLKQTVKHMSPPLAYDGVCSAVKERRRRSCHNKVILRSLEFRRGYLSRWVTLASATANAWTALYGYWKSSVYALLSMRPNCITWHAHTSNRVI